MKINSLRIENLRWHRSFLQENIPWLTLITGPNASGKSSILKGIIWALCGATIDTSIDGKGADSLVMDGEGRALVEMGLAKDGAEHTIKRSIPHTLSVDGVNGGVRRTTELLEAVLAPILPQQLLMCFESSRILRMNDQDRKKLFSGIMGLNTPMTADQASNLLTRWLPTIGVPSDGDIGQRAIEKLRTISIGENGYQQIHKHFYEEKRQLTASIKEAEGLVIESPDGPLPSLEALAKKKVLLEAELELSKAKEIKPEDSTAAILVKPDIEKINGKMRNLQAIYDKTMNEVSLITNKVSLLESQASQIGSAAKQCPFFVSSCPMSPEVIDEALNRAKTSITSDRRRLTSLEKRAMATKEELERTSEELTSAMEEIQKYASIWELEQKVTIGKVRPAQDIEAELELLSKRFAEVEGMRARAIIATENRGKIEARDIAIQKLPIVETLVTAFSPSGIPTMILGEHMERLEMLATQASRMITGGRYEITFSVAEGELDVHVISDGKKRPISSLSASEEIWVSFIISHIMNQYIGNRILMLDEAYILDEDMQRGLEDFLLSVRESYDNIFICATVPPDRVFLPRLMERNSIRVNLAR